MLNRLVKIIYPPSDNTESNIKSFADILKIPNIVLLGEPGAGKTEIFKKATNDEKGKFITAGNFSLYANNTYTNKPVYIDALDEKRSRTEQSNSIDKIIERILQVKPSKLRLSCRAADWLGETDLEPFKPYFEANGGYCVVALEDLNTKEIDKILIDRGVHNPSKFRDKASEKGLDSLLINPQTLIMLADSTQNGQFPKSKKELYEKATDLLLTEHNNKHLHKSLTAYSLPELKDAAGLACASLLMADVEGISLFKSAINSYSSLPYSKPEVILAALTKRAFVTQNQNQELVNCSHRTIAEYLGACYLAKLIREGLPIGRVRSCLGVDGYPASELRGLYAWLTQLLPEHTDVLLTADPYGILIYGDVSCLSYSSRKALLQALTKLSEKDPWFRGQDWTSAPLGALSTPDMANDFKELLLIRPKQFHLISIILDAIKYGEQQPELTGVLLEIFCDESAYYAERSGAFEGLLNAIPNGEALVVKATKEQLYISCDTLRLKAMVLSKIYQGNFSYPDVVELVKDYINTCGSRLSAGDLWYLRESIPVNELPKLLDELAKIKQDEDVEASHEVSGFMYEILKRTLNNTNNIEPIRLWLWLSGLQKFKPYQYSYQKEDEVRNWLEKNDHYVLKMFELVLNESEFDESYTIGSCWYDFQNAVRHSFNIPKIIKSAFSLIEKKEICNEKDQAIFQLALSLTVNDNPPDIELFKRLKNYGDYRSELTEILQNICVCHIDDWRIQEIIRKAECNKKEEEAQQKNRLNFKRDLELICTAQHLGWLDWLAKVYFARFADVDIAQTPRENIAQQLGKENVELALEGLRAIAHKTNLPTSKEIVDLYIQNKEYSWWYSILAGITESYNIRPDLDLYSEQLLKASLAINLLYPSFYLKDKNGTREIKPTWQQDLFQYRPELVQSVYLEIIEVLMQTKKEFIRGIRDICENPYLKNNRAEIVLIILKNYPNAARQELKTLLLTAVTFSDSKVELILLVELALKPRARVRLDRRELWLSIGFIVAFENFKERVEQCIAKHSSVIWVLISIVGSVRLDDDKMQSLDLSTGQIIFLIYLVGKGFPDVEHPTGTHGSQNPWDAADFVKVQITKLSTKVDIESINALTQLIGEPKLASYYDHLKHAVANQAALRRKELFSQPNWQLTVEALSNGKPAHIADLYALTLDHLQDICKQIRFGNTNIFKDFWNEEYVSDKRRYDITSPRSEDSCRNRLIALLNPKFLPLGVNVEPERLMAIEKRADIVLGNSVTQVLPIEIKRDYHADLWTACANQLDRLYTRDPQACGYGIYLVFWFGDNRTRNMKKPPAPITRPNTALELEAALQSLIKPSDKHRLAVVVIDVTRPDG